MTIDELARRSGTTSRNIRAYQERGLLPPPQVVGRVGFYNEGHLARLQHIDQLSDRGFSLAAIRELFNAWEQGYGLEEVLGFEQALAAPYHLERSARVTLADIQQRFGSADANVLSRAVKLGLLIPDDDGTYRVPSPRVLDAGAELVAAGVPLERVLDEAAKLRADVERIASRFVAFFIEFVWQPFDAAGRPADELSRITEMLNRMRPLTAMSVGPLLDQAMDERVSRTAAETLADVPAKPKKRTRKAPAD